MANILILDLLKGTSRLTGILADTHELVYTNTLERALALAKQQTLDLIIVGVLFDDSRMYELISAFKQDESLAHLPIMGFSDEPTVMSTSGRDSIEASTHVLGGCDYIDTLNMTDQEILDRINDCLKEKHAVGRVGRTEEKTPKQKREKQERTRKE